MARSEQKADARLPRYVPFTHGINSHFRYTVSFVTKLARCYRLHLLPIRVLGVLEEAGSCQGYFLCYPAKISRSITVCPSFVPRSLMENLFQRPSATIPQQAIYRLHGVYTSTALPTLPLTPASTPSPKLERRRFYPSAQRRLPQPHALRHTSNSKDVEASRRKL